MKNPCPTCKTKPCNKSLCPTLQQYGEDLRARKKWLADLDEQHGVITNFDYDRSRGVYGWK